MTLRKFTVLSHRNLLKLGVKLFTEGDKGLEQWEIEQQILAFVWERSQPVADVVKAIDDGTAWQKILEFGEQFDFTELESFVGEINRVAESLKSKTVEVIARPGNEDPNTPGN